MTRARAKAKLSGKLGKPIVAPRSRIMAAAISGKQEDIAAEIIQRTTLIDQERNERWLELFKRYGIDPTTHGASENLARNLAEEFIPGFQVIDQKPLRGAKLVWSVIAQLDLVNQVRWMIERGEAKNEHDACGKLVMSGASYHLYLGKRYTQPTLYRAYTTARKACEPILKLAYDLKK